MVNVVDRHPLSKRLASVYENYKEFAAVERTAHGFVVPGVVEIDAHPHRSRAHAFAMIVRVVADQSSMIAAMIELGMPGVRDLRFVTDGATATMLFKDREGRPSPIFTHENNGKVRVADGVTIFNLAQAEAKYACSASNLIEDWKSYWGDIADYLQPAEKGGAH